jgi:hypothetical protein
MIRAMPKGNLEETITKGLYVAHRPETPTKQKTIGDHFHVHRVLFLT